MLPNWPKKRGEKEEVTCKNWLERMNEFSGSRKKGVGGRMKNDSKSRAGKDMRKGIGKEKRISWRNNML